jgi:outer membrane protein TolC
VPDEPPPAVDAGLPATLLDRRPDLRAAELRLRETLAQTDATRLSFYPNLALTGSVGTASTGLSELVSSPLGSLAATLAVPFVQWNQAHFATALARTQYDEAVLRFKKMLWQALSDVDNALSARTRLSEEGAALARSLEAVRTTERLTEIRYRAGAVSLQRYLDAKQSRRQAELAVGANRLAQLENYGTLCLSLGGV